MTYTSSALTFLLEDLGKTVVCFVYFVRRYSQFHDLDYADHYGRSNTLVSIA